MRHTIISLERIITQGEMDKKIYLISLVDVLFFAFCHTLHTEMNFILSFSGCDFRVESEFSGCDLALLDGTLHREIASLELHELQQTIVYHLLVVLSYSGLSQDN